MDFSFQGFQSSLPLWLFLLLFAGTTLLAWWSYRQTASIDNKVRYGLIGLRSSVFLLLLLLLLNPQFLSERTYVTPPNTLVLLDNSASTDMEKTLYKGVEDYQQVLEELNFQDTSVTQFHFQAFGNDVTSIAPDELSFDADQTNLSEAIQTAQQREDDYSAVILISDGIYTQGQNPIYRATELSIPVFSVGLGDTTQSNDLLVTSVSANATGYLDTQQTVSATISSKGYSENTIPVHLKKGDEILSTKTITPENDQSAVEVTFDLLLDEEGLQQYTISIPEQSEEWTTANNSQLFSIDVRDAKQRILSLAFEIHPDVRFVRSLLARDQNIELTTRTWMKGQQFLEGAYAIDPDSIDLAIIHGFPPDGLSGSLFQSVQDLTDQVPLLIAATPLFAPRAIEQILSASPVTATANWTYAPIQFSANDQQSNHPIMELPPADHEQFPNLAAPVKDLELSPGARELLTGRYQGESTGKPILTVQETGNKRIAFFTAYGWYRLNQSTIPQVRDFTRNLWTNTVSWAVTDPDNQNLQVKPEKNSFSESETAILNASLTNERGQPESQASIEVSISSDSTNDSYYAMEHMGGGNYQLELSHLPEGAYSFEASASKENRAIDTHAGEFSVARSNAEYLQTRRNDQLLRQLSNNTGGFYLPYDSVSVFWERITQLDVLEPVQQAETNHFYFNRHIFWFLLAIGLLSAEWIIRKRVSLP